MSGRLGVSFVLEDSTGPSSFSAALRSLFLSRMSFPFRRTFASIPCRGSVELDRGAGKLFSLGREGKDMPVGGLLSSVAVKPALNSLLLDLITPWNTTACLTSAGRSSFGDNPRKLKWS